MNTQSLIKIPGYTYNEYKIVLYPNTDLSDKILKIRSTFSEEYKTENNFKSNPALTLVNFIQFEMIEERLINRLKIIATGFSAFKVELNGFGNLPTHTIYINVDSKQSVQNLAKELNAARQLMTLNKENKPHFIRDPHFIIAGKLLPWQFEKSWLNYSHQFFTGRFIAGEMVLLKRPLPTSSSGKEQHKNFTLVERFEFMNLPVSPKQGDLFICFKISLS